MVAIYLNWALHLQRLPRSRHMSLSLTTVPQTVYLLTHSVNLTNPLVPDNVI